ncbi:23S rRNA (cytidine(2498)-2'-O)-methyltransferase RlmM [Deefgea piscis]|uniref:23S rRNA (Cytidine(2498)-2'-O)-methyltransferase RlmM n=1 Tax=Deefgea piscis TaxID=2739061 RepID=A0A6M8SZ80_9NEIS|nr:23S rRNA (cytidine(2498)-2'-O)-methyltransferase RlmM [Deefgea piscis]QKJ67869.1 23S rRNA (cytidine(2498)-2'-O)-methyltransferase RlmM [Deefgea piscis]
MTTTQTGLPYALLAYCRPGFEPECAEEIADRALAPGKFERGDGWVVFTPSEKNGCQKVLRDLLALNLIFSRQTLQVHQRLSLGSKDRLTPIVDALKIQNTVFSDVWLEHPDSNEGKSLSGFTRKFGDYVAKAMTAHDWLQPQASRQRLHLFFPAQNEVMVASRPVRATDWLNGIPRLRMPSDAPSRSTLKMLEAILVLVDEPERKFREGMTAVDLGAAPGGWTYQLVARGLKVFAVDNGPMKGSMDGHHQVKHVRDDGFKYRPKNPVDWLVCDMVEQPIRIADLIAKWVASGNARRAIFNLKLPMKKRHLEVEKCFALIDQKLKKADITYKITAKQLFHDREEITCYLTAVKD